MGRDPHAPSTGAHVRRHYLGPLSEDPSEGEINDGTLWYNTTVDELRVLKDGAVHNVNTTAV